MLPCCLLHELGDYWLFVLGVAADVSWSMWSSFCFAVGVVLGDALAMSISREGAGEGLMGQTYDASIFQPLLLQLSLHHLAVFCHARVLELTSWPVIPLQRAGGFLRLSQ